MLVKYKGLGIQNFTQFVVLVNYTISEVLAQLALEQTSVQNLLDFSLFAQKLESPHKRQGQDVLVEWVDGAVALKHLKQLKGKANLIVIQDLIQRNYLGEDIVNFICYFLFRSG